ncbi:MAG: DUF444 family protein [Phycisphaeraceae bacterium]|nr:DUF444 family protein [Phycisphaeraceae bacterium]
MVARIEQDHQRFRQIVKGKIRKDLRRFLTRGELIGKEGKRFVSIPVHDIDIPTFRYGDNSPGVGAGDGEGDGDSGQNGSGNKNTGGDQAGKHLLEVDVSLEELADILAEELKLPRIEPKGAHNITTIKDKYSGVRQTGPESLRHFKRTYREALKRQLAMGDYDPDNPIIIPIREDRRYRSWREIKAPQSNAVIVYTMDVSGSMGDEQKELVRLEAFWIDTWLRRNYDGIESRYIVHDVQAKEVDRATFFSVREDGGTRISSALQVAQKLLADHYDPGDWNIYLFHFSDGDNSSESDNRLCVKLLQESLLPQSNMFGYCQVASAYGSGNFINVLHEAFPGCATDKKEAKNPTGATADGRGDLDSRLVTSRVNSKPDIHDSLRTFFAAGR